MQQDYQSVEQYIEGLRDIFLETDGKEKYHEFFHGEGNEFFTGSWNTRCSLY